MSRTASSPTPSTPAPVRFLPEYDNAMLGFADRRRITAEGSGSRTWWKGSVLVDGFVSGTWRIKRSKAQAELEVSAWRELSKVERSEVEAEASALIAWSDPDVSESSSLGFS